MPDTTPTEEQTQVKVLLRRWKELQFIGVTLLMPLSLLIGILYYYILKTYDSFLFIAFPLMIALCVLSFLLSGYSSRYAAKRLIKQMTEKEREILASALTVPLTRSEKASIKHLQKVDARVNPQKAYLRSSQQTQDEPLLRAAAYTDDTKQEQLLRPANNDPQ